MPSAPCQSLSYAGYHLIRHETKPMAISEALIFRIDILVPHTALRDNNGRFLIDIL